MKWSDIFEKAEDRERSLYYMTVYFNMRGREDVRDVMVNGVLQYHSNQFVEKVSR